MSPGPARRSALADAGQDADQNFDTRPVGGVVDPCPAKIPRLTLHVDADRDGKVDDSTEGVDVWTRGKGKKGAVVLCNNDDDEDAGSLKHRCDNQNDIVDTYDESDIAPLVIRRSPANQDFPPGYRAFLRVSNKDRLRIFEKRAPGSRQIIGPLPGAELELPDLNIKELTYGMEATGYPSIRFDDNVVRITLEVQDPAGKPCGHAQAVVRIAPWVMSNHCDATVKVYVVSTPDNSTFRTKLDEAIKGTAAYPAEVIPGNQYGNDRWAQDVMELGYSSMPRVGTPGPVASWNLPVVVRTAADRAAAYGIHKMADSYPKEKLLGRDFGYHQAMPPTLAGRTRDSFGNLECSPPVKVNGREYPFGRIVYGRDASRPMQKEVVDFLYGQQVQAPFDVDTSWLAVGHVDEMLSFCPVPASDPWKRFKLVMASPELAIDVLKTLKAHGEGADPMFQGIDMQGQTLNSTTYPHRTPDAVLGDAAFVADQLSIQAMLNQISQTMVAGLGLLPSDVIWLPVLFRRAGGDPPGNPQYLAYTPDVVNMLVVTRPDGSAVLCVPKPFGPMHGAQCRFEEVISNRLVAAGVKRDDVKYIDDFFTYHEELGEIHCATNSQRKPRTDAWWWEWRDL